MTKTIAVKWFLAGVCMFATTGSLSAGMDNIRNDHPRLFFNQDTLPQVLARASGPENAQYQRVKKQVDEMLKDTGTEPKDLGTEASKAAFVFLMTDDTAYLDLARQYLDRSLAYYESRYQQLKPVSWYLMSRLHALAAWDWLYNVLPAAERDDWMARMIRLTDSVTKESPHIPGRNLSGFSSGFYGVKNLFWYVGIAAAGTGIEPELVSRFLRDGYSDNMQMLAYRKACAGDDGGSASATVTYSFGAYPWAEYNFFYTIQSATGRDIAGDWPNVAMLSNHILWNWISAEPMPFHYGNGDVSHETNYLVDMMETEYLYSHLANIRHFYGKGCPEYAALAEYLQNKLPADKQMQPAGWFFFYPFLQTQIENASVPFDPEKLPPARNFDEMGQVFMRSGMGENDTYALFTCGGSVAAHRHYDNLNFVIYHGGHLAMDTGTRWRKDIPANMNHLLNYFSQTVAHNCVVIHQPGEPNVPFWGMEADVNHGGQHKVLGSVLKGFEINDLFPFVYVAGDATECYRQGPDPIERPIGEHDTRPPVPRNPNLPDKADLVTRQMVFLPPNHFVVFDRVKTTDAGYRKDWLIHTANEPQIENKTIRADHMNGRMFCRTLLPADAKLTPVGGPGHEFEAGGRNWPLEGPTEQLSEDERKMMGRWRVEVTPGAARKYDVFLHVIQVGDQTVEKMDEPELLESDSSCGIRLKTGTDVWTVEFNKTGALAGHIYCKRGDLIIVNQDLTETVQKQSGITAGFQQMTYEEAVARIPERTLPPFWMADNQSVNEEISKVRKGKVSTVAKTVSGRPMFLVEYGEAEPIQPRANFGSAVASWDASNYMDRTKREKPVVFFVGPVHGQETEGLVGVMNLIHVMETGQDLRGREQPRLLELAQKCRILILPNGNPDGVERFKPHSLQGMWRKDVTFWGQGTWGDNRLCFWPQVKGEHPRKDVGFLGCYFNDQGINAMHDEFFAPMGKEVPAILKIARREGPDLTVALHSFSNDPELLKPEWVPMSMQKEIRELAVRFNKLCDERNLPHGKPFEVKPDDGETVWLSFNLVSALYHTSGTSAFVFEAPAGVQDGSPASLEQTLDIQFALYEAMLEHALENKNE